MKYVFSKAREAINGKVIQFVVWVIAFTTVFTSYANKGFSSVANRNNDTFITYNRTLEPSGIMIIAIPAAIFAIVLMMIWFKANQRVVALPIAQKIGLSRFIKTGGLSDERIVRFISFIKGGVKRKTKIKTVNSSNSNRSDSSGGGSLSGYMAYTEDLKKTADSLDNDRKRESEIKRQEDEERRTQVERQRKEREDKERARRKAEDARKHAIYLEEQARKQDRINSENRHADRQNKLAENARREAQELKRKLR